MGAKLSMKNSFSILVSVQHNSNSNVPSGRREWGRELLEAGNMVG